MVEYYLFGSVSTGEVDVGSDIDMLALTDSADQSLDLPQGWSVYTRARLQELFTQGSLFAWHLYLESVRIWPKVGTSFIKELGSPSPYIDAKKEIELLLEVMTEAAGELQKGSVTRIYELGLIAVAARDIAMAASKSVNGEFVFSRFAPLRLKGIEFPLSEQSYRLLLECRRSSTRGNLVVLPPEVVISVIAKLSTLLEWGRDVASRIDHE